MDGLAPDSSRSFDKDTTSTEADNQNINIDVALEEELLNEIDTQNVNTDFNELNDDLEQQLLGDGEEISLVKDLPSVENSQNVIISSDKQFSTIVSITSPEEMINNVQELIPDNYKKISNNAAVLSEHNMLSDPTASQENNELNTLDVQLNHNNELNSQHKKELSVLDNDDVFKLNDCFQNNSVLEENINKNDNFNAQTSSSDCENSKINDDLKLIDSKIELTRQLPELVFIDNIEEKTKNNELKSIPLFGNFTEHVKLNDGTIQSNKNIILSTSENYEVEADSTPTTNTSKSELITFHDKTDAKAETKLSDYTESLINFDASTDVASPDYKIETKLTNATESIINFEVDMEIETKISSSENTDIVPSKSKIETILADETELLINFDETDKEIETNFTSAKNTDVPSDSDFEVVTDTEIETKRSSSENTDIVPSNSNIETILADETESLINFDETNNEIEAKLKSAENIDVIPSDSNIEAILADETESLINFDASTNKEIETNISSSGNTDVVPSNSNIETIIADETESLINFDETDKEIVAKLKSADNIDVVSSDSNIETVLADETESLINFDETDKEIEGNFTSAENTVVPSDSNIEAILADETELIINFDASTNKEIETNISSSGNTDVVPSNSNNETIIADETESLIIFDETDKEIVAKLKAAENIDVVSSDSNIETILADETESLINFDETDKEIEENFTSAENTVVPSDSNIEAILADETELIINFDASTDNKIETKICSVENIDNVPSDFKIEADNTYKEIDKKVISEENTNAVSLDSDIETKVIGASNNKLTLDKNETGTSIDMESPEMNLLNNYEKETESSIKVAETESSEYKKKESQVEFIKEKDLLYCIDGNSDRCKEKLTEPEDDVIPCNFETERKDIGTEHNIETKPSESESTNFTEETKIEDIDSELLENNIVDGNKKEIETDTFESNIEDGSETNKKEIEIETSKSSECSHFDDETGAEIKRKIEGDLAKSSEGNKKEIETKSGGLSSFAVESDIKEFETLENDTKNRIETIKKEIETELPKSNEEETEIKEIKTNPLENCKIIIDNETNREEIETEPSESNELVNNTGTEGMIIDVELPEIYPEETLRKEIETDVPKSKMRNNFEEETEIIEIETKQLKNKIETESSESEAKVNLPETNINEGTKTETKEIEAELNKTKIEINTKAIGSIVNLEQCSSEQKFLVDQNCKKSSTSYCQEILTAKEFRNSMVEENLTGQSKDDKQMVAKNINLEKNSLDKLSEVLEEKLAEPSTKELSISTSEENNLDESLVDVKTHHKLEENLIETCGSRQSDNLMVEESLHEENLSFDESVDRTNTEIPILCQRELNFESNNSENDENSLEESILRDERNIENIDNSPETSTNLVVAVNILEKSILEKRNTTININLGEKSDKISMSSLTDNDLKEPNSLNLENILEDTFQEENLVDDSNKMSSQIEMDLKGSNNSKVDDHTLEESRLGENSITENLKVESSVKVPVSSKTELDLIGFCSTVDENVFEDMLLEEHHTIKNLNPVKSSDNNILEESIFEENNRSENFNLVESSEKVSMSTQIDKNIKASNSLTVDENNLENILLEENNTIEDFNFVESSDKVLISTQIDENVKASNSLTVDENNLESILLEENNTIESFNLVESSDKVSISTQIDKNLKASNSLTVDEKDLENIHLEENFNLVESSDKAEMSSKFEEEMEIDEELDDSPMCNLRRCASLVDEIVEAAVKSVELSFHDSLPKKPDKYNVASDILSDLIDSIFENVTESKTTVNLENNYCQNIVKTYITHRNDKNLTQSYDLSEFEYNIKQSNKEESVAIAGSILNEILNKICYEEIVPLNTFLESILNDVIIAATTREASAEAEEEDDYDNGNDIGFTEMDSYDDKENSVSPGETNDLNILESETKIITILSDMVDPKRLERVGLKVEGLDKQEEFDIGFLLNDADKLHSDELLTSQKICSDIMNEIIDNIFRSKNNKRPLEDETLHITNKLARFESETDLVVESIIDEIIFNVVYDKNEIISDILNEIIDKAVNKSSATPKRRLPRKCNMPTMPYILNTTTIAAETFEKLKSPVRQSSRIKKILEPAEFEPIPYIKEEPLDIIEIPFEEVDIKPILPLPEELLALAAEELKRQSKPVVKRNQKKAIKRKKVKRSPQKTKKKKVVAPKVKPIQRAQPNLSSSPRSSRNSSVSPQQLVNVQQAKIKWKMPPAMLQLQSNKSRIRSIPSSSTIERKTKESPMVIFNPSPSKRSKRGSNIVHSSLEELSKGLSVKLPSHTTKRKTKESPMATLHPSSIKRCKRELSQLYSPTEQLSEGLSVRVSFVEERSPPEKASLSYRKAVTPTKTKVKQTARKSVPQFPVEVPTTPPKARYKGTARKSTSQAIHPPIGTPTTPVYRNCPNILRKSTVSCRSKRSTPPEDEYLHQSPPMPAKKRAVPSPILYSPPPPVKTRNVACKSTAIRKNQVAKKHTNPFMRSKEMRYDSHKKPSTLSKSFENEWTQPNKYSDPVSFDEKLRRTYNIKQCVVRLERTPYIDHLLPTKTKKREANICELCEPKRFFVSKDGLVKHLKNEHGDTFGGIPQKVGDRCPGCDKKYHSSNRLTAHMKTCPAVAVLSAKANDVSKPSTSSYKPVEEELRYQCDICGSKFSLWSGFESHKKSHLHEEHDPLNLDMEEDGNSRKFKSELLRRGAGLVMKFRREKVNPSPNFLKCEICGLILAHPSQLDAHRMTHVRIKEERLSPEVEIVEEFIVNRPTAPVQPIVPKATARKSTGGVLYKAKNSTARKSTGGAIHYNKNIEAERTDQPRGASRRKQKFF